MKTRLLALLIVFFSSVGLLSAQSSSPCPPNCEWASVGNQPPGCVCDELFIDGSGLYIVLFAGMILAVYFYSQKHKMLKKA